MRVDENRRTAAVPMEISISGKEIRSTFSVGETSNDSGNLEILKNFTANAEKDRHNPTACSSRDHADTIPAAPVIFDSVFESCSMVSSSNLNKAIVHPAQENATTPLTLQETCLVANSLTKEPFFSGRSEICMGSLAVNASEPHESNQLLPTADLNQCTKADMVQPNGDADPHGHLQDNSNSGNKELLVLNVSLDIVQPNGDAGPLCHLQNYYNSGNQDSLASNVIYQSSESHPQIDLSSNSGFEPDTEDLNALKEIMKEGVSMVGPAASFSDDISGQALETLTCSIPLELPESEQGQLVDAVTSLHESALDEVLDSVDITTQEISMAAPPLTLFKEDLYDWTLSSQAQSSKKGPALEDDMTLEDYDESHLGNFDCKMRFFHPSLTPKRKMYHYAGYSFKSGPPEFHPNLKKGSWQTSSLHVMKRFRIYCG